MKYCKGNETMTTSTTLRLTEAEKQELKEMAKANNMTITQFIRYKIFGK